MRQSISSSYPIYLFINISILGTGKKWIVRVNITKERHKRLSTNKRKPKEWKYIIQQHPSTSLNPREEHWWANHMHKITEAKRTTQSQSKEGTKKWSGHKLMREQRKKYIWQVRKYKKSRITSRSLYMLKCNTFKQTLAEQHCTSLLQLQDA